MTIKPSRFRELHVAGEPLVLANVWDAGSARIVANLGAKAIATTSGGVAWSNATTDGGALRPQVQVELAHQLSASVNIPISFDIENGYSNDASEVASFLNELAEAGAAGVNLEDSSLGSVRKADEFAKWLGDIRSKLSGAGADLFLNIRADNYLLGAGESTDQVLSRANNYVEAGADGLFLPGLADLDVVSIFCREVNVPVNVMAGPGSPSVSDFAATGVSRISTGTWLAQAAYGVLAEGAKAALQDGSFVDLENVGDYGDLNTQMGTPDRDS